MENKELLKKVKFDFMRAGTIGAVHVEAECYTVEQYKEALAFAVEASKLLPLTLPNEENIKV